MSSIEPKGSHRLALEKRAAELIEALLRREISITEGLRGLVPVLSALDIDSDDLHSLVGYDSELDGLPIGSVREYWNKNALAREDDKRIHYEDRIRDYVVQSCRKIMQDLGTNAV